MLYDNKRWDVKADPFTLGSLIAWLEKQPGAKRYKYMNCDGRCLYGQYMKSVGVSWDEAAPLVGSPDPHKLFREEVYGIAFDNESRPPTFGAALSRARKALSAA